MKCNDFAYNTFRHPVLFLWTSQNAGQIQFTPTDVKTDMVILTRICAKEMPLALPCLPRLELNIRLSKVIDKT